MKILTALWGLLFLVVVSIDSSLEYCDDDKSFKDDIMLERLEFRTYINDNGSYIVENIKSQTISEEKTALAVTPKNQHLIYPGALFFATRDLVEGEPQQIIMPRAEMRVSLDSRICCTATEDCSATMVPTHEAIQEFVNRNIQRSYSDCQTIGVLPRPFFRSRVKYVESRSQVQVELGYDFDVTELIDDIDYEGVKNGLKTIRIGRFASEFFEVKSEPVKPRILYDYIHDYFTEPEETVYQYFKRARQPPAIVDKVTYGKWLILKEEYDEVEDTANYEIYGQLNDSERAELKEAHSWDELVKIIRKITSRFDKSSPPYPMYYTARIYSAGGSPCDYKSYFSLPIKFNVVTMVGEQNSLLRTVIEMVNNASRETRWEFTYDIVDYAEDGEVFVKRKNVTENHWLDEHTQTVLRLPGNRRNVKLHVEEKRWFLKWMDACDLEIKKQFTTVTIDGNFFISSDCLIK